MTARRVVILAAATIAVILVVAGIYYFLLPLGPSTTVTIVAASGQGRVVFAPANFTVTEGQHVTIVFDNTDDGPHEFQIPAFGVSTGIVQAGESVSVNFVPNKVGAFIVVQPCPQGGLGPCPPSEGQLTVLSP